MSQLFPRLLIANLEVCTKSREEWCKNNGIPYGSINKAQAGRWAPGKQQAMQWAIALGLSADQTADFLSAAAAHKAAIQASNGSRTGAISDALAQVTQERDQLRIELACVRADLHDTAVQRDEVTAKASALSVQLSSIRAHFAEVVAELSKTNPSIVPLIKTGSALINDHGAHASVD